MLGSNKQQRRFLSTNGSQDEPMVRYAAPPLSNKLTNVHEYDLFSNQSQY